MTPAGWDAERPIRKIRLEPDVDDLDVELSFDLLFQHTDTYPETEPHVKVSNPRGLGNADVDALTAALHGAAAENVGMASVFAVMQAGKDWLDTKAGLTEGGLALARCACWFVRSVLRWEVSDRGLHRDASPDAVVLLQQRSCHAAVDPAVLKKQQEEAAERARAAQRAQGTLVTIESFQQVARRL